MKRFLFFPAVLLVLFALTGCGNLPEDPVPTDTPTPEAEKIAVVNTDGSTEYVIVRGDTETPSDSAVTAAVSLRKALTKAGAKIGITTDYDGKEDNSGRCEILIGKTNRALSEKAAEGLSDGEYRILFENGKIAIVAGNDNLLGTAVTAFLNLYLQTDTAALLWIPGDLNLTETVILEECPKMIETVYPTADYVVADVVATDAPYNADPTGESDATSAIQKALDACEALGGGTVWLPAGTYRVTGTITIPCQVTLRGDRRNPDEAGTDYGTVISADVKQDIGTLFLMRQNSGARGLTVYYPHQSAETPKDYGWVFEFRATGSQGPAIGEITFINAYKGIGLSAPPYESNANSNMYLWDIRGTALSEGLTVYNNAGACSYEDIHFHNRYWLEAGAAYNAPDEEVLNAYTRKNGIAFTFGDLEMPLIYQLSADNYRYGIWCAKGARMDFWGAGMAEIDIRNTDIALFIEHHNTPRMSGIVNSTLEGSEAAIRMCDGAELWVAGCELQGEVIGEGVHLNDLYSYTEEYPVFDGEAQAAVAKLYDVTKSPYNAPCAPVNQDGDLGGDCTEAIQKALDDAGAAGGGIVYLPAGYYTLQGTLTVPAGVELRGAGSIPTAPGPSGGTTLFLYAGKDSTDPDNESAGITLAGDGAGMRYLQLFYPENPFATKGSLVEYPYAVRMKGAENAYCVDVLFANPCRGLDIGDGCDGHYVKRISGTAAYNLVRVGKTEEGRIETLHDINPGYWTIAGRYGITTPWMSNVVDHFHYFQKENCDLIIINGATDEHLLNILQFGGRHLVVVNGGEVGGWNLLLDQGGQYCVRVNGGSATVYNSELTGRADKVNLTDGGELEGCNAYFIR